MNLNEFDYELPEELIAHEPESIRDNSRLMVVNRFKKTIEHKKFSDIVDYFKPEDVLVVNNTKVIPARLIGVKQETGAVIELLLLKKVDKNVWIALVKPSKRVELGTEIFFDEKLLKGTIIAKLEKGMHVVKFLYKGKFKDVLDQLGKTPIPPYIKREETREEDRAQYQTVYARYEGSVAAPTAGLHFSNELIKSLEEKGVIITSVLLHVGYGTFAKIEEEEIEKHKMHSEFYRLRKNASNIINTATLEEKKIFSVGTTSARVLETCAIDYGLIKEGEGNTDMFIYPGYDFKIVDRLITNFHLPKSTLLLLVSAFAGQALIKKAYEEAIREKYRFFSYGDAMIIV